MIHTLRFADAASVRYRIEFPEAGIEHLVFGWPTQIDAALEAQIVALMRHTTAGAPIIGFAEEITDTQAAGYLAELRGNLAAGKCRLLTIFASTGLLIGLCTLRRNLNPNNAHITDLAKGMIREEFRGAAVLPAAFHEIAMQCERDGVELLTLDVRAETPAYHAWKRFGFESYGFLADYARVKGQALSGHFMMQKVADLKDRALKMLELRLQKQAQAETASA
jgi:hypothetical protein